MKSLMELVRPAQFSLMEQVKNGSNRLIVTLSSSDVMVVSCVRECWTNTLFL